MTSFVDSNVLIRHLTGDPPRQARAATTFLEAAEDLFLVDLIVAETVYVLESVYRLERDRVATVRRVEPRAVAD